MTLSVETPRVVYTGDGSTTTFAYTFTLRQEQDLKVYNGGSPATDYNVDLSAKTVRFGTPPAIGSQVELIRQVALEQTADYDAYDEFPAQTHEKALDDIVIQNQQQADRLNYTLSYDPDGNLNPVWNAKGLRIAYVADPADPQDAVTVKWLQASGNSPGLDGPPGEAGPPGFGEVVADYAALRNVAAPLSGMIAYVSDAGAEGTFTFDDTSTEADDGGIHIAPSDGTPGVWIRDFQGDIQAGWFGVRESRTTAFNSGPALQAALDAAGGRTVYIDFGDVYIGDTTLTATRRFAMAGRGMRETRIWTDQPGWMLRHTKPGGNKSPQCNLTGLRFDGGGASTTAPHVPISEGVFIDNVNFSKWTNVEFREMKQVKLVGFEDSSFDMVHSKWCGDRYVTSDTGSIDANSSTLAVVPSGPAPDFNVNDVVTIAGAGPNGTDLESVIRAITGNSITISHNASVQVSGAELTRGRPGFMLGNVADDGETHITNSLEFGNTCIFERNIYHGFYNYRGRAIKWIGCKFHGILENDDPNSPAVDQLVMDRAEACEVVGNQFVEIRRSAIRIEDSGDSTAQASCTIVGNNFDRPANYDDGQDLKVVQLLGGAGRIGENVFNDHLNHPSYINYGIDVYLGPDHLGWGGRNTHYTTPSQTIVNDAPERGRPISLRLTAGGVNRGGYIHNTFTPTFDATTTYTSDCVYHRNANMVQVTGIVTWTDKAGSTAEVTMADLPFALDNAVSAGTVTEYDVTITGTSLADANKVVARLVPGSNSASFWAFSNALGYSRLTFDVMGDASILRFTLNYVAQN